MCSRTVIQETKVPPEIVLHFAYIRQTRQLFMHHVVEVSSYAKAQGRTSHLVRQHTKKPEPLAESRFSLLLLQVLSGTALLQ